MANLPPAPPPSVRHFKSRREPATEHYYRTQFRFSKPSVRWLSNHFLGPDTGETRGGALNNQQRMEIALRYYADPGFQNGVSEVVGVSQATVSRTVAFVTDRIVAKRNTWIVFPRTTQEFDVASQSWQATKRFPYCFGAVDGCLIKVQVPPRQHNPAQYYSGRKKFHCINIQGICGANCEFLDVDASWPGSVHDARVWRNSGASNLLSTGVSRNYLLIGDSAYPLKPYLMKPFPLAETAADPRKMAFNRVLSSDRVTVEHCFGQLKSRFQMLRVSIRLKIENTPKLIVACCILHNVGKYLNDNWEDDETDDKDSDRPENEDGNDQIAGGISGNDQTSGQARRDVTSSIINSTRRA